MSATWTIIASNSFRDIQIVLWYITYTWCTFTSTKLMHTHKFNINTYNVMCTTLFDSFFFFFIQLHVCIVSVLYNNIQCHAFVVFSTKCINQELLHWWVGNTVWIYKGMYTECGIITDCVWVSTVEPHYSRHSFILIYKVDVLISGVSL